MRIRRHIQASRLLQILRHLLLVSPHRREKKASRVVLVTDSYDRQE